MQTLLKAKFVIVRTPVESINNKLPYNTKSQVYFQVTEDFLWKNGDGTGHMENEVANSAHYWFLQSRLKSPVKPFENKKFFVYDGDTKSAAYTRLILAGGGEVVTEIQKATIIIRNKVNSTQKDPIAIPAGIPVESPMILSQWIIVPIQERS